jgi:penicillin-binding protein 1A
MNGGPVRQVALMLIVGANLVGPSVATLWVSTPSGADVQQRVQQVADHYGVSLMSEDEVPPGLVMAVVATEDERFYTHHGIDSLGAMRAVLYDIANLCLCQGGSTITEQLVKEVYLGGSDAGYNKIVDIVLAFKVEGVISKQRIMADYLSVITTGFGRRGMKTAACAYFQAPLENLTIGQYALLAGVAQAPSVYDPTVNPELARQRRAQVVAAMLAERYITLADAAAANAEPVLVSNPAGAGCKAR